MTTFKAAACAIALCGGSVAAAVVPVNDNSDEQAVEVRRAQAPTGLFGGGLRLGVSVRDLEDADAKSAKSGVSTGAVVDEVFDQSAAETGGVRTGDIIVEFDGERVRSARQFTRLVQETPDGRKVAAVVIRDGQRMNLSVEPRQSSGAVFDMRKFEELGRDFNFDVPMRPSGPPPTPRPARPPTWNFDDLPSRGGGRLGITVDTLSPQLAEYFGTREGVLVKSVQDNSPAAKIGIKAGDVITSVNGSTIDDAAELRRRLQGFTDGEEVTIGIVRDKKPQTLKGKLEGTARRRTYRTTV